VVAAGVSFAVASSVRSNGLLNALFPAAFAASVVAAAASCSSTSSWYAAATVLVPTAVAVFAVVVPFAVFNGHMHAVACGATCVATSSGHGAVRELASAVAATVARWLLPGSALYTHTGSVVGGGSVGGGGYSSSASASASAACCARGPWGCSMYSAVQRDFWDVGFLRYFQWKQLPNFALACPAVAVAVYTVHKVARTAAADAGGMQGMSLHLLLLAHLVHMSVTVFVGVFVAHVQITTRMLCSACPLWYLGLSLLLCQQGEDGQRHRVAVITYLIAFNILGLLLHPNFLPYV